MKMKKILILSLFVISTVATSFAIPPGCYVDNRGTVVFVVSRDGKEMSVLNRDGNVIITQDVIDEQYDNEAQAVKVTLKTRVLNTQTVIYYREDSNGNVQMDDGLRVLNRE